MPSLPKPARPKPRSVTLPAVQLLADDVRLKVFSSEADAVTTLRSDHDAELYDALGRPLQVAEVVSGFWMLRLRGDGDADALQSRVLDVLSEAADLEAPGSPAAAEAQALIAWLDGAPSVRHFIFGLGLAPVRYLTHPTGSERCKSCSWIQKLYLSGCCP